jgi:hypothetical protein
MFIQRKILVLPNLKCSTQVLIFYVSALCFWFWLFWHILASSMFLLIPCVVSEVMACITVAGLGQHPTLPPGLLRNC